MCLFLKILDISQIQVFDELGIFRKQFYHFQLRVVFSQTHILVRGECQCVDPEL